MLPSGDFLEEQIPHLSITEMHGAFFLATDDGLYVRNGTKILQPLPQHLEKSSQDSSGELDVDRYAYALGIMVNRQLFVTSSGSDTVRWQYVVHTEASGWRTMDSLVCATFMA
jgi:hypothetical protein